MIPVSQIMELCKALNSILWTVDEPAQQAASLSEYSGLEVEMRRQNFQCTAHAMICAALLCKRGEDVVIRGGSAIVVYPEQKDPNGLVILKHWWITSKTGLCDLSINLEGLSAQKPIVFSNKNISDPTWIVSFGDSWEKIIHASRKCHEAGRSGLFYQTDGKKSVNIEDLNRDLEGFFPPANSVGIPLRYIDIVKFCESLLAGETGALAPTQFETWRNIANC